MTNTRDEYRQVFDVYWPIGVAVFCVIAALVVFVLIRYRARRDIDEIPRGRDESKPGEGAYALILACVAAVLVAVTFGTQADLKAQFAQPAGLHVRVVAARWNWRFEYPESGAVVQGAGNAVPTLYVPEGVPIDFTGTSRDVQHAFWIPDERFKRDVFSGRTTTWQMTFDDAGFHEGGGACAEFCGLRHANMSFNVDVLSQKAFERWAKRAAKDGS
jgi:cytochrome c oxidase subunit 2